MAWTTLAKVKEYLGITGTADDTLLTDLLTRLQEAADSYLDRKIEQASYTEQYDGDGTDRLLTRQWPIISVTSVYDDVDRVFGSDALIAAADYVVYKDRGIIQLDGLTFASGIQNVKVIYSAGYGTVPTDLVQALIELIAARFRQKEMQGLKSLSLGAYSISFDPGKDELSDEVRATFDSYRRTRVA